MYVISMHVPWNGHCLHVRIAQNVHNARPEPAQELRQGLGGNLEPGRLGSKSSSGLACQADDRRRWRIDDELDQWRIKRQGEM